MVLFASSLHFFSEACLLDPWATEAAFCKIPFFNAFRSKEIWLDAFQHISNDPPSCFQLPRSNIEQIKVWHHRLLPCTDHREPCRKCNVKL